MLGFESRVWNAAAPSVSRSRTPGGWLLPARVLLFGLAVPLLLRLKLERLAAWIEPSSSSSPSPRRGDRAAAEALTRRIDFWLRAGRPFVRSGCLPRGLTQYRFLRRAGFPVSLRFGIGELKDKLDGHCWLVLDGEPLAERRDPRPLYTETWRIPWEPEAGGPLHEMVETAGR